MQNFIKINDNDNVIVALNTIPKGTSITLEDGAVVTANMEKRIERVVARDNTTRQDVEARIRCQMSDEEKIEKSDDVIDNSHSLDALHKDIERLLEKYEKRNIL